MLFTPTWRKPLQQWTADGALLLLRLWLGQEFLYAAWHKLSNMFMPPEWFVHLDFPCPLSWLPAQLNWAAAGWGELLFGLALVLGIFSRIAALGLLGITWVAVYTVHFDLGWAGWRLIDTEAGNGFKVPLMMALMLLVLLGHGAGRWSLEHLLDHDTPRS